jgi:hypothetical protein
MVIFAIVVAMAAVITRAVTAGQKRSITSNRMAAVDVAIAQFVAVQRRLPCPADGRNASGVAAAGTEIGARCCSRVHGSAVRSRAMACAWAVGRRCERWMGSPLYLSRLGSARGRQRHEYVDVRPSGHCDWRSSPCVRYVVLVHVPQFVHRAKGISDGQGLGGADDQRGPCSYGDGSERRPAYGSRVCLDQPRRKRRGRVP